MPEEIPIPENISTGLSLLNSKTEGEARALAEILGYRIYVLIRDYEQQIKLIQENTTDLIAAAENRTHKAEEKLEALQWKPITPETIFDKETYYLAAIPKLSKGFHFHDFEGEYFQRKGAACHLLEIGRTHYRPINPPAEQPGLEAE